MLKKRKALVFASSRGLGYGSARAIALHGASVAISSRTEEELTRAQSTLIDETGSRTIHAIPCDLTRSDSVAALIDQAAEVMDGLDILVINSAGPKPGVFEALEKQDWKAAYESLIEGPVLAIRKALPHLRKSADGGRVICITSVAVQKPILNLTLSNVLRPAVEGLVRTLALECAKDRISVNAIEPGRVYTSRIQQIVADSAKSKGVSFEEEKTLNESQIPFGRYGEPNEFGELVAFLASKSGGYITGQSIVFDGGLLLT